MLGLVLEGEWVRGGEEERTNERQPNKLKPHYRKYRQPHPQPRLRIQRQPEKPSIRRVLALCAAHAARAGSAVLRLKDPMGVAGGGVDFVPPAQADEAAAGDVFEVVEVGGEEEHGYYEDEDTVLGGKGVCVSLCGVSFLGCV